MRLSGLAIGKGGETKLSGLGIGIGTEKGDVFLISGLLRI